MTLRLQKLCSAAGTFLLGAAIVTQAQVSVIPSTAEVVAGDTVTFLIDGLPTDTNYPLCTVTLSSYDPERVRVISETVQQPTREVTVPDPAEPGSTITYTEYVATLPVAVAGLHRMEGLFDPVPVAAFVRRQDSEGWISFDANVTFNVRVLDPTLALFPFDDLFIQQSSVEPIVLTRTADAFGTLFVEVSTDIGHVLGMGPTPDPATHSDRITVAFDPFETIQVLYASGKALAEQNTNITGRIYARVGSYCHEREITVTRHPEVTIQTSDSFASKTIHAGDSFMLEVTRQCSPDQLMSDYTVALFSANPDIAAPIADSVILPAGASTTWVQVGGKKPGQTTIHAAAPNAIVTAASAVDVTVLPPELFFLPQFPKITVGETGVVMVNRANTVDSAELVLQLESLIPRFFQPVSSTIRLAPGDVSAALQIQGLATGDGLLQVRNGSFSTNVPVRVVDNMTGIRVSMSPPEAVVDGAQWRVDGGAWQESGVFVPFSPGMYTVEFRDLPAWVSPAARTVEVLTDLVSDLSVAYTPAKGLVVFLSPPEAIAAGARWRTAEGAWHNSGAMETNVSGVSVSLEFKALDGWFAPTNLSVSAPADEITYVERTYYAGETLAGSGTELGQVRSPSGLAFDSQGRLYVAEADFATGHSRVQRRNPDATWEQIGGPGTAPGEFSGPVALACDGDTLYVGDITDDRVHRRAPDGTWEAWGGTSQSTPPEIGKFRGPFDLAVDDAGGLIVADLYNNRVQRRAPDGTWSLYLSSGTGPAEVWMPSGTTWWNARVVVADYVATEAFTRVRAYAAPNDDGDWLGSSRPGEGHFGRAYGLNAAGSLLLAADAPRNRILGYEESDAAWRVLFAGPLNEPRCAVVGPDGMLYVADTGNHRILRIELPDVALREPLSFLEPLSDHALVLDMQRSAESSISGETLQPMSSGTLALSPAPDFVLGWAAHPQARYTLQEKTNLADRAETWKNISDATAIPGDSGWIEIPVRVKKNDGPRFFRVLQVPVQ